MVATNIAYHINDTNKSYPASLKTTSRHNSLRGLRHCKHQVLLHVNLASETLYSVSRRYRYPEIYIYQTSNAGGGHDKTGDWPKDEQIPKVRAKSLPACCNPRLSFDLRFLWTVEVDGCLCSCRIVVFSPTAPIIADRISKYGTITVKGAARNGKRASAKSLQPLLAVLIPEVESTIRSSSCKCVMDRVEVQWIDREYIVSFPVTFESEILALLWIIDMVNTNSSFYGANQKSLLIRECSKAPCLVF